MYPISLTLGRKHGQKLDGRYDTFEANILTSDDTSRDANISVEIYVDDVLVGRVDNIVRDENVRPISVSVNGGKVLMIKAINTDSASGSICSAIRNDEEHAGKRYSKEGV